MPKKTTLRGQFLRTVLLMLACSLLVGLAVIVAVMIAFVKKVPDGEQFLMDSVSFLFGKEVLGPNGMIHVVVLAAIALCLLVVLVCVLLASRYTSRVAAALREFRRAADDLRKTGRIPLYRSYRLISYNGYFVGTKTNGAAAELDQRHLFKAAKWAVGAAARLREVKAG